MTPSLLTAAPPGRDLDASTIDWLSRYVTATDIELMTDHPWARTYRVAAQRETCYLKVLPPQQRGALNAMPLLARRFPDTVGAVVAVEASQGLILWRDHGGQELEETDERHEREVLRTYAALQAAAAAMPDLLALLPRLDLPKLLTAFLKFLDPRDRLPGNAGAAHFLGETDAAYYFDRMSLRRVLLEPHLEAAGRLPPTVNHCDLRTRNTAAAADGSVILFDWDEAVAGPAGLSLHNFFSGCSAPAEMLLAPGAQPISVRTSFRPELLDAYTRVLEEQGYARRNALQSGLPGAICAGVMQYLISYGKFPMDDPVDRQQVARILVRRLDDMLAMCDFLAAQDRQAAIRAADDYQAADALRSARAVLQRYLAASPHDAEIHGRLAAVLQAEGETDDAEAACRRGLEHVPADAALRGRLGCILLDRLQIEDALDHLRMAAALAPHDPWLRAQLDEAVALEQCQRQAAQPGCVPRIRLAAPADGSVSRRPRRRLAARLFREYGTLLIEDAFCPKLLGVLAERFFEQYGPRLGADCVDGALQVGDKRYMVTVDVEGPFNTPELYAAAPVAAVLGRVLGDDYILGGFTAVASLGGARDMRMHKDHPALFDAGEVPGPLPHFAVTVLVPLLGLDPLLGTTRVVKGSHRCSSEAAAEMEFQDPFGPQGACLLMDYRLSHQGLANRSQSIRPVLSLVYNRPWFRDCVNYQLQDPLRISRQEFQRVPEEFQSLFAWTRP